MLAGMEHFTGAPLGAEAHTRLKALGCYARRFEPVMIVNEDLVEEIDKGNG